MAIGKVRSGAISGVIGETISVAISEVTSGAISEAIDEAITPRQLQCRFHHAPHPLAAPLPHRP